VIIKKGNWAIGIKEPLNKLIVKPEELDSEYYQEKPGLDHDLSAVASQNQSAISAEKTLDGDAKLAGITKSPVKGDANEPNHVDDAQSHISILDAETQQLDLEYCESWVALEEGHKLFFEMDWGIVDTEDIVTEKNLTGKGYDRNKIQRELRLCSTYQVTDGLIVKLLSNGDILQIRVTFFLT
jgi:hypothetical protein